MSRLPLNQALELPPEQMRELGYRVVDLLVDHFTTLPDQRVVRLPSRAELERRLRQSVPETGRPPAEVLAQLAEDVLPFVTRTNHPRFFAFVPVPGNYVSAMADALVAGFGTFAGTWFGGAASAELEILTIDWLRELCGLPESAFGLFVSGGSMANLTALAAARHHYLGDDPRGAVVYCSDQTHSAVERALRVLGFGREQIRKLESDSAFRLPLPSLARALDGDRAAGRRPFCVVANAGTTNTGAVDPLAELSALCRRERLWLHVDGAYGAPAVITEPGRRLLAGLEEADSLALDPHKWLFQPPEMGCVLLREGRQLRETFRILPEYLKDVERGEEEVNFCDYGIQLTRSFRSLKLWMSLQVFGLDAFRQAVARGIELAELAERWLRRSPGWEVVTPAQLGVVTFRFRPPGVAEEELDAFTRAMIDAIVADGFAGISSTALRGRTVARFCTCNPRTTDQDIEFTLEKMQALALERLEAETTRR
ncbi:MAG TPA: aminotransferase class I/II-fold pyridoxal phosphate-dependent enzyme [Thermoanaerobaculia bacterium]|nr:aminotransferase class I/II-fold pyridoxal phosphate-dependent enzyme [Thermoanaerobaculia bacterium]